MLRHPTTTIPMADAMKLLRMAALNVAHLEDKVKEALKTELLRLADVVADNRKD